MPRITRPPPRGVLDHLVKRFSEGRISASDFLALKHWLESDPYVPDGKWFKRFETGVLTGRGERVSTFLARVWQWMAMKCSNATWPAFVRHRAFTRSSAAFFTRLITVID
jgi:hypothetical protein